MSFQVVPCFIDFQLHVRRGNRETFIQFVCVRAYKRALWRCPGSDCPKNVLCAPFACHYHENLNTFTAAVVNICATVLFVVILFDIIKVE